MARISSIEQLRTLYSMPMERAVKKELPSLDRHHKRFIALSPFLTLASRGASGKADVSPRGDKPGFVLVPDDTTLLIPDWPGNNRLDTLQNIIETSDVGLLFMVPGVDEQLRVNGTAELRTDDELRLQFDTRGRNPKLVIKVAVEAAYLHCAKAIMRARLWDPDNRVERSVLPTMGEMLRDQIGGDSGLPESQSVMVARYREQLY